MTPLCFFYWNKFDTPIIHLITSNIKLFYVYQGDRHGGGWMGNWWQLWEQCYIGNGIGAETMKARNNCIMNDGKPWCSNKEIKNKNWLFVAQIKYIFRF